jgi:hypothetical protein
MEAVSKFWDSFLVFGYLMEAGNHLRYSQKCQVEGSPF